MALFATLLVVLVIAPLLVQALALNALAHADKRPSLPRAHDISDDTSDATPASPSAGPVPALSAVDTQSVITGRGCASSPAAATSPSMSATLVVGPRDVPSSTTATAPESSSSGDGYISIRRPYVYGGIAAGVVVFILLVGVAVWIIKRRLDRVMALVEKRDGDKGQSTAAIASDQPLSPLPPGAAPGPPSPGTENDWQQGDPKTAPGAHLSPYSATENAFSPQLYTHGAAGTVSHLSMPSATDTTPYLSMYSVPDAAQPNYSTHGAVVEADASPPPVEMWVPQPGTPLPPGPEHRNKISHHSELSGSFGAQGDAHGISEMDAGDANRDRR